MKRKGMAWLGTAAALGLMLAGCDSGTTDNAASLPPAVDANGEWNVAEEGVYLGIMTLTVGLADGDLGGDLKTKDGAQARLYGEMGGYAAHFTMVFPAEKYDVNLVFAETGDMAAGTAVDSAGFSRTLALTRRTGS